MVEKSKNGADTSSTHSQISIDLETVILKTPCSELQYNNDNGTIIEEFFLNGDERNWERLGHVVYNEPIPNIERGYNLTYSINVTGEYYLLVWISTASTGEDMAVKVSFNYSIYRL